MLNPLPKRLYSGCGCPTAQTGNSTPCAVPAGALICDDKYRTLTESDEVQLLGVRAGSNCQAFLKGSASQVGFAFYRGGGFRVDSAPQMTLPLLNPPTSGVYPNPGGFKYMTAAVGDPGDWRHFAAPSAGTWILYVKNGQWQLLDAGAIPGIQEVGAGGTTPKGQLLTLVQQVDGSWLAKKLEVVQSRVVVGDIDGSGVGGYKPLAPSAALVHPIGKFQEMRLFALQMLDSSGTEVAGGMKQAVVTGAGAVTDGVRMIYTPTTKELMKAPPATIAFTKVTTLSASTNPPASYAAMPGGHGAGASRTYNYDTVRIDFEMRTNAAEIFSLGLFKDGTMIQEFAYTAAVSAQSFFYTDTAVVLGNHTYEVRWQKVGGGSGLVAINYSGLMVTCAG